MRHQVICLFAWVSEASECFLFFAPINRVPSEAPFVTPPRKDTFQRQSRRIPKEPTSITRPFSLPHRALPVRCIWGQKYRLNKIVSQNKTRTVVNREMTTWHLYHDCPFLLLFVKYPVLCEKSRKSLCSMRFRPISDHISDGLFSQTARGSMVDRSSTIFRLCCMVGWT